MTESEPLDPEQAVTAIMDMITTAMEHMDYAMTVEVLDQLIDKLDERLAAIDPPVEDENGDPTNG